MEGVILTRIETTPPHGDVIRADVRRPAAAAPRTAVVVAHGFKGFKDWGFFPLLCNRLALDGHIVVSFNTSLNGIGAGLLDFTDLEAFGRNTVSREVADLHWIIDCTLEGAWDGGRRPEALGLLGHSRGGGNAVIVAAERGEVSSLVTWAAVSTYHRWSPEQERDWATAGVTYILNARTGQEMPLQRSVFDDLRENAERFDILAAAGRVRARGWSCTVQRTPRCPHKRPGASPKRVRQPICWYWRAPGTPSRRPTPWQRLPRRWKPRSRHRCSTCGGVAMGVGSAIIRSANPKSHPEVTV